MTSCTLVPDPDTFAIHITFTLTMYPVVLSIIPVSALVGVMLVVSYHTIDFRFLPAAWKAVFWSEEQKKKRFALVYNKGGLLVEREEAEMELALAARCFVTERIHGKGINEEELLFGEEKEDEEALHNYITAQAESSSSKSAKKKKRGKKDSKFITVPRETNMKKDDPVFFPNFDPENPKLLIDPEHLTEEEESQLREEDAMLHASLQQMKKKSGSFFHHADFDHAADGPKTPGINKSRTPSKMLIMTPIKKSGSKEQYPVQKYRTYVEIAFMHYIQISTLSYVKQHNTNYAGLICKCNATYYTSTMLLHCISRCRAPLQVIFIHQLPSILWWGAKSVLYRETTL